MLPEKHLLFDALVTEFHSRRFSSIQGSVTLSQVTISHSKYSKLEQITRLQTLAKIYNVSLQSLDTACYYQDLGELDVRWDSSGLGIT